jgi:hypothetical protein
MSTGTSDTHHREHRLAGMDRSVERVLGADMRLIYGFLVPILMVVGLIILLGFNPHAWLVAPIIVLEVAGLFVVVYGLMAMLNEPEEDEAGER